MNVDSILTNLKNRRYSPIYFLEGEESYFIDKISDFIVENVLTDVEKEFNQSIIYGKEADAGAVIELARRYPMMSEYRLVVVREAQSMRDIDGLIPYIEKPMKSTILVVNYKHKKIDKRKKLYKAISKEGVYFESKPLYDSRIPGWIVKYLKERNYGIDPRASQMIVEHVGSNLKRIVNELEKVIISLSPGTSITPDDVEKNVGISKDYNAFELQDAIGRKDVLKANRIVKYFGENQRNHPFPVILGILFSYFKKLLVCHFISNRRDKGVVAVKIGVSPYFVDGYLSAIQKHNVAGVLNAISLLREYDLRSKGARGESVDTGELLKELIYRIIYF